MKKLHGVAYEDMGGPNGLPEDQRIAAIGSKAMVGQRVGVLVEDDEDAGKPDRYVRKVVEKFPAVELVGRRVYMHTEHGTIWLLTFARKSS